VTLKEWPEVFVETLPGERIIRITRNHGEFGSTRQIISVLDEVLAQLRLVDRSKFGLLIDTRAVPFREDPEFEAAFRHWRVRVAEGFARAAVVVASPEGQRQAEASSRRDGAGVRVFADEPSALEWLRAT
jgi:hypothetical protein